MGDGVVEDAQVRREGDVRKRRPIRDRIATVWLVWRFACGVLWWDTLFALIDPDEGLRQLHVTANAKSAAAERGHERRKAGRLA